MECESAFGAQPGSFYVHSSRPHTIARVCACLVAAHAFGCSSRSDPSEKNFEQAINDYYEANCEGYLPEGLVLTTGGFFEFPIDAYATPPQPDERVQPGLRDLKKSLGVRDEEHTLYYLDALVEADLLDKDILVEPGPNAEPRWGRAKYDLTSEGRALWKRGSFLGGNHFCYATLVVDEITNFTLPSQNEAVVWYTYTAEDAEDWIYEHEKFDVPRLKLEVLEKEPQSDSARLVLTGRGWKHVAMVNR